MAQKRPILEFERYNSENEARLLYDTALEIGSVHDTDSALKIVLRQVCETTGWVLGQTWLPNQDGTALELSAVWVTEGDHKAHAFAQMSRCRTFEFNEGFVGRVWSSKRPIWICDLQAEACEKFLRRAEATAAGIMTVFAVPVLAGDEVIAVLEFFRRSRSDEDETLKTLIATLGAQLGWTIRHKRAHDSLRASADLLKCQNQALELAAQGAPLHETLDLLLRGIEAQCAGMLCSILLLDADGVHVRHGAAPSLPESFSRAFDGQSIGPCAGSCGTAAFLRTPVIVTDVATDPLWENYREFALKHDLRACWSTPIFDGQRHVLGTFALYFRLPCGPTRRHQELIDTATHTAAIAIVKHRETEALRTSEERLRLAVACGRLGIWEWDIATNRVAGNDELKAAFGWPSEEQLTLPMIMEAIYPEDRQRIQLALQFCVTDRADYDVEYRIRRPDGSLRWVETKGRCEYDGDGKPIRMVGSTFDKTERKRAEEELQRRESQLAEAQRIAKLGSYEWDIADNQVRCSDELYRIFGTTSDQFGATFSAHLDRVHPEDRSASSQIIEQSFREHKAFEFEERIIRPDGASRTLDIQGKWIFDEAAKPVKLVGICQDITERKQASDQLRQSEERFQFIARATNDAFWDWDLNTGRLWWNQGITTLFGYSPEEAGSADWKCAHIHPEDQERALSRVHAVMESGRQFCSSEYRFMGADGGYSDIYDCAFVIYDSTGKPVRMIGAMTDISERKRTVEMLEQRVAARTAELQNKNQELEHEIEERQSAEALLRTKNEELKFFAYSVSHDLKAPLRGIAGYSQELFRRHSEGLGERALFCLKQISVATHNLDRLIEDLLHYSRLDSETPTGTEVHLVSIIESILNSRRKVILDLGADVQLSLSAESVTTWERGLLQILANLIDNSLTYSRNAHPPKIRIASERTSENTLITISDNGIGFDMKYHDRIFGLFNRLVRQEEFEGTGAGLAIVKKLVEKLGGKVWAESKPDLGARFMVELPSNAQNRSEES